MEKINKVLLVAGTHGNELSGIYLKKLIKERLYFTDRSTLSVNTIIANPEAVKSNVRYIYSDLNREFSSAMLNEENTSYEGSIARQLTAKYANIKDQLIIDLHNTTSNMGATLILLANIPLYQKMGAYVKQRMPNANVLFEDRKAWEEQPYLCTLGHHGIMIEVGAQAHGSLKFETLKLMKEMVTAVLDFVEKHNLKQVEGLNNYEAYYYTQDVKLPLDSDGMRLATVHPTICGKDFQVVKPGAPILATFFGYDIHWEHEQETYPHFINESAYQSDNIAMALAEKKTVSVR